MQKGELEAKIADIRAALATEDVQRIRAAREALDQSFYKISEDIYRQSGAPGGDYSAPQQETSGSGTSDDTIEGEYKEM